MANKKEHKPKSTNQPKEHKTIAEQVQLRLSQLDQKSSNISKQIDILQKRVDDANKLKSRIEKLKSELGKVKKAKEAELDELSLMCNVYYKQTSPLEKEAPKTSEEAAAQAAYEKLS
jgi:septal ring factor EnvC (AmiA/AmiB activator)